MGDVDDMIDYIRSLKKGFDKDLFQNKIDHLAYIADTTGFDYHDFHTLFKLWLNLSIPITKWTALGMCLVPPGGVQERTVDYAFRWLLNNCQICDQQGTFSRTAFLLDWLTAAMDSNAIDMTSLDAGYEIFHTMLSYEVLAAHAVKLVYSLTKPSDVTRRRVLELMDHAKKREGKKNMLKQIQVLLGLFKSYKPECVPEDIPAISIHTSFRKINATLMQRFDKSLDRGQITINDKNHLLWTNPINSLSGRNKKAAPLVPNMEYTKIGSTVYSDKEAQKNYFDFADAKSLLQYSIHFRVSRPARLRALLCNETGLALLAVSSHTEQAFLSYDLQHLLTNCFLNASPYTYAEKQDLLHRLAVLQRTLLQGIPVVTAFLARYLPLWNEKDFFGEILELVEWLHVESVDQLTYITEPLVRIYRRSAPLEQCAILTTLTHLYDHLLFTGTRNRQHFLSMNPAPRNSEVLSHLATCITQLSQNALQVAPDDIRMLYCGLCSCEAMARAELRYNSPLSALPRSLPLALWLLTPSAAIFDKVAALLIIYRKIFSMMKATNQSHNKELVHDQRNTLESYTHDILNCLYHECAFAERKNSLIFHKLHPQLVSKLTDLVPQADARFSLRNHLAFATYTYMPMEVYSATNKQCLEVLAHSFGNLHEFLTRALPIQ